MLLLHFLGLYDTLFIVCKFDNDQRPASAVTEMRIRG